MSNLIGKRRKVKGSAYRSSESREKDESSLSSSLTSVSMKVFAL